MQASRPEPDDAGVLTEADALIADGRRLDAIKLLTNANLDRRDDAVEELLVRVRHEAFDEVEAGSGLASWPPSAPDLFPDAHGPPEVAVGDLSADTIRSGIVRHGCLLVRQLIAPERVAQLTDDIDRTFEAYDARLGGANVSETAPWCVPFKSASPAAASLSHERPWVRGGGGVLTVDSPRSMFDVLDAFADIGLVEKLGGYMGERPALSVKKWTLRRVPLSSGTNWHQDGAFLGEGIRTVNVWLALSHCGDQAPGLDVVARRFDDIVETGTEGAIFDWSVGEPVVERAAQGAPIVRPVFEPGDALLFDEMFLHRTAIAEDMTLERYAVESWFFAPSHYPRDQVPVVA